MCRPDVYVTASSTYIVTAGHCRPEFGINAGKSAIIVCDLYRLNSAGAAFCAHLASFMHQMGYTSCKADPDLWYKAETRPDDKFRYYAYILCYVDNILCVQHGPMTVLNMINGYMPLKPSSVGILAWGLSPSKYVAQAVKNCAKHLIDKLNNHFHPPQWADNPFPYDYCPELD